MVGCAVEIGRAFRRAGLDSAGELHSRVDYTPYGVAMHSYAADLNGNGTIDGTDVGLFLTNLNSGSPLEPGDANYDPDADFSGDGLLGGTATDEFNAFNARYSAYSTGGSNPTVNAGWIDNPTDAGGPDNSVGYDGYWFDLAGAVDSGSTGLYMVRHRVYDPGMGRWGERDPLSFRDGNSMYQYVRSSPAGRVDTYGLTSSGNPSVAPDLGSAISQCDPSWDGVPAKCISKCRENSSIQDFFECRNECYESMRKFQQWYRQNEDLRWTESLPPCPCKASVACSPDPSKWEKPTTKLHNYHDGAEFCMRSKPVKVGFETHANQCCYDSGGRLITHGSGSGSADKAPAQPSTVIPHHEKDVYPANWAEKLDGGEWGCFSEAYLKVRPQVGSSKCAKNP
jgi:RHS repeat-associated protein